MIFIAASIAWMFDGWLETKASLVIQNVILLLINAIGVWRWFPKAEKEAKESSTGGNNSSANRNGKAPAQMTDAELLAHNEKVKAGQQST